MCSVLWDFLAEDIGLFVDRYRSLLRKILGFRLGKRGPFNLLLEAAQFKKKFKKKEKERIILKKWGYVACLQIRRRFIECSIGLGCSASYNAKENSPISLAQGKIATSSLKEPYTTQHILIWLGMEGSSLPLSGDSAVWEYSENTLRIQWEKFVRKFVTLVRIQWEYAENTVRKVRENTVRKMRISCSCSTLRMCCVFWGSFAGDLERCRAFCERYGALLREL